MMNALREKARELHGIIENYEKVLLTVFLIKIQNNSFVPSRG